jgi:hypothetical protein
MIFHMKGSQVLRTLVLQQARNLVAFEVNVPHLCTPLNIISVKARMFE